MKNINLFVGGFALALCLHARAQSAAVAGHLCSGEEVVPMYSCINVDAPMAISFEVEEFQDCKDGNITNLAENSQVDSASRKVFVYSTPNPLDYGTFNDLSDSTTVTYASQRTHIDDDASDITMVLPVSAVAQDGGTTFNMSFSTVTAPDFEGSDDWHFVGSFKATDAKGATLNQGALSCIVRR